jgi:ABC-2 type transport system permease protein
MAIEVALMQQNSEQERQTKLAQSRAERDSKINKSETDLTLKVKQVQDRYKMLAVLLPPIPPLLLAVYVFFSRRAREREGVARSRLR